MTRGSVALLGLGGLMTAGLMAPAVLMGMAWTGGQDQVASPSCGSRVALAASTKEAELDERQRANAATVVAVGRQLGIPQRGLVVALAVAYQESGFRNYANDGAGGDLHASQKGIAASLHRPHDAIGSDHGSLGIFQQQWPWWGSMEELMDPATSAARFYDALLKVPDWESLPVTEAGQAVQRSAYPDAYADDVPLALELLGMDSLDGTSAVPAASVASEECAETAAFSGRVTFPLQPGSGYVDQKNFGNSGSHWEGTHSGTDFSVECGTPVLAATDGRVVVRTDQAWSGRWLVQVSTGEGRLSTWYAHMQAVTVRTGDLVHAGQPIGAVGNEGNSTGCHLHFEVHSAGGSDDAMDPSQWLRDRVGDSVTAATYDDPMSAPTIVSANVSSSLPADKAREDVQGLLDYAPHVLLLQEVQDRNIAAFVTGAGGNWGRWQPRTDRAGTAIIWNADHYTPVAQGDTQGQAWVVLRSRDGRMLPIVSVDGAAQVPELVRAFAQQGYSPLVGGTWGTELDRNKGVIRRLGGLGFGTNWLGGQPCRVRPGDRVDGFAFATTKTPVAAQGCLPSGNSDHRPVWVALGAAQDL